jgi:putative redox protein
MLTVHWRGGMAFEAEVPSGNNFTMDAIVESGGHNLGPSPVEALLSSAAACSAMDVVLILEKKRQVISDYRIEVEWQRPPQGQHPRPILSIVIRHIIRGENLDERAVARAVELSDQKYCTVVATLRHAPAVSSEYRIE